MDLGEAIYREITGRSSRTEVSGFQAAINYLTGRFGSATAAAKATGFPPSSFRHWVSSGRVPGSEKRADVVEAALLQQRRDRLPAGREAKMRRPGALADIRMVGSLTYDSAPEPERDVDLGSYMDEVQNELLDAYLDGATPDELAEIFVAGVEDDFYRETLDENGDSRMSWDVSYLDGWR